MQNKNEKVKVNIGDRISDFVQRNRKAIAVLFGLLIVLFIGLIAYLIISDNLNKKAIAEVEELVSRYENLDLFSTDDYFTEDTEELLVDLETFANSKKGYPGSKAWFVIGQIYSGREDWVKAEESWSTSARVGEKTYLGPISLFNAASAAQEQGKYEQAIIYLKESVEHKFEFPSAPHAQFSIGRLYEQLGNSSEAIEAYRLVLSKWPDITVWNNLARSRIISIESN
ncbi:MAG: tetratricopeptide repeat protein [Treponema sp.]|nr:tetratricopeptide repeat protein [Treponema sp.]